MRFADTNVLLYAVSRNPEERHKAIRARGLLTEHDMALSTQVLQEFYVQATRASSEHRFTHEQAAKLVEGFLRFRVAAITLEIVRASIVTRERFQISYWDAAIIEAARSLGCDTVLSEDLSDGQDYGGVRVENPFRAAAG